ncbi:MAG: hypothetical protein LBP25_05025 [Tannerellaceae bacterium]|jgi:hypothetical protein|nr:hypothetical protein [Tannerellaceae bacterium]
METIQKFFRENPHYIGVLLILAGIGLCIYTVRVPSGHLLRNTTNRYRAKDFSSLFGEKSGGIAMKICYFILSLSLIASGITVLFLWK